MGKNVKWKYEPYAFYNKAGIEERLGVMAEQGWFIEKMGMFWKYCKGEPAKRTYNVVYVEEPAHEFEEQKQQEFVEYCEAAGWKRCFAKKGMLIFYHESEYPVPIETDPELALANIHKAMKEVYLQRYLSFGTLAALYIYQLWNNWKLMPFELISSNYILFFIAYFLLVVAVLFDTGFYYAWKKKAFHFIDEYEDLLPVTENKIQRYVADWAIYVVLIVAGGVVIGDSDYAGAAIIAVILALLYLVYMVDTRKRNNIFKDVPKPEKKIKNIEIKQPWGFLLIVLIGLIIAILVVFITFLVVPEKNGDDESFATVTYKDYYDSSNLVVTDSHYWDKESLLVKSVTFSQFVEGPAGQESEIALYFSYRYVEVKCDRCYDFAFETYLKQENIEMALFDELISETYDVKEVYLRDGEYLILWNDAFAHLDIGRVLSNDELKYTIEKLRNVN